MATTQFAESEVSTNISGDITPTFHRKTTQQFPLTAIIPKNVDRAQSLIGLFPFSMGILALRKRLRFFFDLDPEGCIVGLQRITQIIHVRNPMYNF